MKKSIIIFATLALVFLSCKQNSQQAEDNGFTALDTIVKVKNFQKEVDGKKVDLYTLKNDSGLVVKITNYGARIVSILMPDKNKKYADINVGLPSIEAFQQNKSYYGAIVGRYGNRIAKGKFKIDGKEYSLAINNYPNTLHGGIKGYADVVWEAVQTKDTLSLTYISTDMEEGYPGKLTVNVKYVINNNNELKILFEATTDKKTIVNLTSHTYFNLKGEGNGDILSHELEIPSDLTTPVDSTLIPSGKFDSVKNTPFDFNAPLTIGSRINDVNKQLKFGMGYDHNYVLKNQTGSLALVARVTEPESGRVLEILSPEPGVQFYSGNFMDGKTIGKSGKPLNYRSGLALEPQHYPDSPNHSNFPSVILEPGKKYNTEIVYKFSTKK